MTWKVKVNRDITLNTVKVNRDAHNGIYLDALEKYRQAVIDDFEKKIAKLKAGKEIDTYVRLPVPEDHTKDYDYVIGMLEASVDDTIELGISEFSSYIKDDWDWKTRWIANTQSYTS